MSHNFAIKKNKENKKTTTNFEHNKRKNEEINLGAQYFNVEPTQTKKTKYRIISFTRILNFKLKKLEFFNIKNKIKINFKN